MSIKAKQVAGVTALVVLVVAGMITVQIASLTRLRIDETASRAKSLKEAILHSAAVIVREAGTTDPYVAIKKDGVLRSILETAVTSQPDTNTILYAAIVDTDGNAVAHSVRSQSGFAHIVAILSDARADAAEVHRPAYRRWLRLGPSRQAVAGLIAEAENARAERR